MKFYIENKRIRVDATTLPDEGLIDNNEGYECEFFFDSEWNGMVKTARFMKGNEYYDVILTDDKCSFPVEAMGRVTEVGVYSSPLKTTNAARVPFLQSILSKLGLPGAPLQDVYLQLINMLQSGFIKGDPFTFEDFTPEQLESLKVKGDPGVYVGSEEPEDENVLFWIDPEGEPTQEDGETIEAEKLNLLVLGDSIFGSSNGKAMLKKIPNVVLDNRAVSGATLANGSGNVIYDQLATFENDEERIFEQPDMILLDGGANDWLKRMPLGNVPSFPELYREGASNQISEPALDDATALGGLSKLFNTLVEKFPEAQRFYIIPHKMFYDTNLQSQTIVYTPLMDNSTSTFKGFTVNELYEKIRLTCEVYGVKVIDIFKESILNAMPLMNNSLTDSDGNLLSNKIINTRYFDYKGLHPTVLGYEIGYLPHIKSAFNLATKK